MNKNKSADNFLLYIPVKNHSNWRHENNVVYLVFRQDRLIERFVAWLTRKPTMRDIKLDNLGTRVWQLIDGNNNVYKIGQMLQKEFGKSCDPVYDKLTAYLRFLHKRGWVKFKKSEKKEAIKIN